MLKNYVCLFLLLVFSVSKAKATYDGASLQLILTGTLSGSGAVGDAVTFIFAVTNTGTEPISNISVTDGLGLLIQAPLSPNILTAGATGTLTATYYITQNDVDQSSISNFASAIGFTTAGDMNMVLDYSDDGIPENGDDNATIIILTEIPTLSVTTIGNAAGAQHAGDGAYIQYQVSNTGNVPLSNVSITDASLMLNLNITDVLYPGSSFVMSVQIVTTQEQFDQGQILVSPTAIGFKQNNEMIVNVGAPLAIQLAQSPDLALIDTGVLNGNGQAQVGDAVTFTFTVTNTGNVTIGNVLISDVLTGTVSSAVIPSVLAPGQTGTLSSTHIVTQQDLDNCFIAGSAVASGMTTIGTAVNKISDNGDPQDGDNNPTIVPLCALETGKLPLDSVVFYPNPVAGMLTISNIEAIENIQVLSAFGQTLINQTAIGSTPQIDFSGFSSGVYFVKVQSGQAEKITKIIKQ